MCPLCLRRLLAHTILRPTQRLAILLELRKIGEQSAMIAHLATPKVTPLPGRSKSSSLPQGYLRK